MLHVFYFSYKEQLIGNYESMTPNISAMLSNMTFSTATTSLESMSSVFELGPDVNVVLQGRIGQVSKQFNISLNKR